MTMASGWPSTVVTIRLTGPNSRSGSSLNLNDVGVDGAGESIRGAEHKVRDSMYENIDALIGTDCSKVNHISNNTDQVTGKVVLGRKHQRINKNSNILFCSEKRVKTKRLKRKRRRKKRIIKNNEQNEESERDSGSDVFKSNDERRQIDEIIESKRSPLYKNNKDENMQNILPNYNNEQNNGNNKHHQASSTLQLELLRKTFIRLANLKRLQSIQLLSLMLGILQLILINKFSIFDRIVDEQNDNNNSSRQITNYSKKLLTWLSVGNNLSIVLAILNFLQFTLALFINTFHVTNWFRDRIRNQAQNVTLLIAILIFHLAVQLDVFNEYRNAISNHYHYHQHYNSQNSHQIEPHQFFTSTHLAALISLSYVTPILFFDSCSWFIRAFALALLLPIPMLALNHHVNYHLPNNGNNSDFNDNNSAQPSAGHQGAAFRSTTDKLNQLNNYYNNTTSGELKALAVLMLTGLALGLWRRKEAQSRVSERVFLDANQLIEAKVSLEGQRQQQETLLLSVLPAYVAEQVKRNMLKQMEQVQNSASMSVSMPSVASASASVAFGPLQSVVSLRESSSTTTHHTNNTNAGLNLLHSSSQHPVKIELSSGHTAAAPPDCLRSPLSPRNFLSRRKSSLTEGPTSCHSHGPSHYRYASGHSGSFVLRSSSVQQTAHSTLTNSSSYKSHPTLISNLGPAAGGGINGTINSTNHSIQHQHQHPIQTRRGFNELFIRTYNNVSLLYADIVGFTQLCTKLSASNLVKVLNNLFSHFDHLADQHKIMRIKILGDCYYGVSGIPEFAVLGAKSRAYKQENHAINCVNMGLDMIDYIGYMNRELALNRHHQHPTNNNHIHNQEHDSSLENEASEMMVKSCSSASNIRELIELNMRIGIHSGHIHSGVIGLKKWQFDVWSNDVSIAMHCESSGTAGRVQVTQATLSHLKNAFTYEQSLAGSSDPFLEGQQIRTYLIKERANQQKSRTSIKSKQRQQTNHHHHFGRSLLSLSKSSVATNCHSAGGTSDNELDNKIRAATFNTIHQTILRGAEAESSLRGSSLRRKRGKKKDYIDGKKESLYNNNGDGDKDGIVRENLESGLPSGHSSRHSDDDYTSMRLNYNNFTRLGLNYKDSSMRNLYCKRPIRNVIPQVLCLWFLMAFIYPLVRFWLGSGEQMLAILSLIISFCLLYIYKSYLFYKPKSSTLAQLKLTNHNRRYCTRANSNGEKVHVSRFNWNFPKLFAGTGSSKLLAKAFPFSSLRQSWSNGRQSSAIISSVVHTQLPSPSPTDPPLRWTSQILTAGLIFVLMLEEFGQLYYYQLTGENNNNLLLVNGPYYKSFQLTFDVNSPSTLTTRTILLVFILLLSLDSCSSLLGYSIHSISLIGLATLHLLFFSLKFVATSGSTVHYIEGAELLGPSILLMAILWSLLLERQLEYANKVNFLWRNQLSVDHEELEYISGINKLLLENILPSHVVQYYLNQQNHQQQDQPVILSSNASKPDVQVSAETRSGPSSLLTETNQAKSETSSVRMSGYPSLNFISNFLTI